MTLFASNPIFPSTPIVPRLPVCKTLPSGGVAGVSDADVVDEVGPAFAGSVFTGVEGTESDAVVSSFFVCGGVAVAAVAAAAVAVGFERVEVLETSAFLFGSVAIVAGVGVGAGVDVVVDFNVDVFKVAVFSVDAVVGAGFGSADFASGLTVAGVDS